MFAAALTRRAYLPCGSVLYSVRFGCTERRGTRTTADSSSSREKCVTLTKLVWIVERGYIAWCLILSLYYACTYSGPGPLLGAYRYIARMDIYEDFAPRKYPVTVFTRFVDATGYWARRCAAPRREEFFEFFAWFANTAGIYSNTSIRSGNILTRRNFDSRAPSTTMTAMPKSLKHYDYLGAAH